MVPVVELAHWKPSGCSAGRRWSILSISFYLPVVTSDWDSGPYRCYALKERTPARWKKRSDCPAGGSFVTHEDAGHYAAKHPSGTLYDPALAAALKEIAVDGRITCTAAHDLAGASKVTPAEIGKTADLLEYRIIECQMGLYGYSPEKRLVKAAGEVSDDLRSRLLAATKDGRISCISCWKIAQALEIERMAVAEACEGLGLKVKPCQLGAF
jgi:hypothetical protein